MAIPLPCPQVIQRRKMLENSFLGVRTGSPRLFTCFWSTMSYLFCTIRGIVSASTQTKRGKQKPLGTKPQWVTGEQFWTFSLLMFSLNILSEKNKHSFKGVIIALKGCSHTPMWLLPTLIWQWATHGCWWLWRINKVIRAEHLAQCLAPSTQ